MNFAEWQFVFTNGSKEDQDVVWNAIKGKAVQMNGTVISTTPTEFMIAGSSDDIDAKKPDITLKFEDKVPAEADSESGADSGLSGRAGLLHAEPFHDGDGKGQVAEGRNDAPPKKAPVTHHKPASQ